MKSKRRLACQLSLQEYQNRVAVPLKVISTKGTYTIHHIHKYCNSIYQNLWKETKRETFMSVRASAIFVFDHNSLHPHFA